MGFNTKDDTTNMNKSYNLTVKNGLLNYQGYSQNEEAFKVSSSKSIATRGYVATTIYEDAVELGKAHHFVGAGHLDSASGSFGKNTSFTADIHDPVKGHADPTRDDESLCA